MLVCAAALCLVHVLTLVSTPQIGRLRCCAERKEGEALALMDTQVTYIFNLLNFTYCLNGSCIFNDSLSPTDTANHYPGIAIVLLALGG